MSLEQRVFIALISTIRAPLFADLYLVNALALGASKGGDSSRRPSMVSFSTKAFRDGSLENGWVGASSDAHSQFEGV